MRSVYKTHPVHGKCLFVDNGVYEVGIALEFGIRVVHFSFLGEENVFYEQPLDSHAFETPEGWRLRGGHRLWIIPEDKDTYFPDNAPVDCRIEGDTVILTQREDPALRVVKSMEISLHEASVRVKHTVRNTAKEARRTAIWPISVMAAGGVEKIPLPEAKGGSDPLFNIAMWSYSSLSDERISFSKEYLTLAWKELEQPLKIGVAHPEGEVRYERGKTAFCVNYNVQKDEEYPHNGTSYETFFSKYMVEIESLSPMVTLLSGERGEHTELWRLERI